MSTLGKIFFDIISCDWVAWRPVVGFHTDVTASCLNSSFSLAKLLLPCLNLRLFYRLSLGGLNMEGKEGSLGFLEN